jgi:hypothetical protein
MYPQGDGGLSTNESFKKGRNYPINYCMAKFHHRVVLAIAAATASPVANAKKEPPPSYCHGMDKLAEVVVNCVENKYFAQASEACLEKIEKEIQAKQQILSAAMLLNNANTASAQGARLTNNSANLTEMILTLNDLKADAQKARAEILAYSQNFVYPGPMTRETARKLGLEGVLSSFRCHANNMKKLVETVKRVDRRIEEFQKSEKAARALEATTNQYVQRVDGSSMTQSVSGRAPASVRNGAPAMEKKTHPQGKPTITGEIGESDRALQEIINKKK